MSGTIVVDRIESDASYASSINIASPLVVSNTINMSGGSITGNVNFDSGTLFVDSVGNKVGIGTSSPGQKLDVNGAIISTGAISSHLTNSSSMSYDGSGEFSLRAYGATVGTGYMTFSTGGGGNSAGGVRMTIDSAGRVTKPYQPSFSAGRGAGAVNGATGSGTEIVFNIVNHDTGSNYNSSTGRFTAPVAGKYYFSTMGMLDTATDGTNADIQLRIGKNGNFILSSNPPVESGNQQGMGFAASLVLDLAAGDYVSCFFYSSATTASKFYGGGSQYNNFSGFLIG